MYKVNIDQIDDSSAGALQNSLYLFRDFLEQADIPEKGGDPVQDKNLKLAVNKQVVQGEGADHHVTTQHVRRRRQR